MVCVCGRCLEEGEFEVSAFRKAGEVLACAS